jgi:hypothetical protein
MQPRLLTCENTLKWVSEQAIPSLEHSFVTRRFPVFRGTTAGPIRRRRHTSKGIGRLRALVDTRARPAPPMIIRGWQRPQVRHVGTALATPEPSGPQQISLRRRGGTVA